MSLHMKMSHLKTNIKEKAKTKSCTKLLRLFPESCEGKMRYDWEILHLYEGLLSARFRIHLPDAPLACHVNFSALNHPQSQELYVLS